MAVSITCRFHIKNSFINKNVFETPRLILPAVITKNTKQQQV